MNEYEILTNIGKYALFAGAIGIASIRLGSFIYYMLSNNLELEQPLNKLEKTLQGEEK